MSPPTPEGTVEVAAADLAEGETRSFEFERAGERMQGFLVRHGGELHAYVNRCPHVGYALDFGDGRLMDPSREFIQCMSHGAMFLPESGECVMGPALGHGLERMPVTLDEGRAVVTIPPEPVDWP